MKIISIGDLHGLTTWKIINPELYDKIIFLGDYVDSFSISDEQILNNLLDVIQFKKDNPNKVTLLWGNHDLQYLFIFNYYGCSGYRNQMYEQLHKIYNDNKELFQMSYQTNDTIWTHAGIHQGWYNHRFNSFRVLNNYDSLTISTQLEIAFKIKDVDDNANCLFDVGHRRGGYYNVGGPFWCDVEELKSSPIQGYNQIVGHNRVKEITKIYRHNKEIVFVDCLENNTDNPKFYEKEFK